MRVPDNVSCVDMTPYQRITDLEAPKARFRTAANQRPDVLAVTDDPWCRSTSRVTRPVLSSTGFVAVHRQTGAYFRGTTTNGAMQSHD